MKSASENVDMVDGQEPYTPRLRELKGECYNISLDHSGVFSSAGCRPLHPTPSWGTEVCIQKILDIKLGILKTSLEVKASCSGSSGGRWGVHIA